MAEKVVVHSEDSDESMGVPKTNGETKKAKSDGREARKEKQAAKEAKRAERSREEEKKWRQDIENKVASQEQEIRYKEAKTPIEVIRALQEVSQEGKVLVDSKELDELKNLLKKYTKLDEKTIEGMSTNEAVSAVQIVIKNSQIVVSEDDLQYKSQPEKVAAVNLLKAEIAEVQTGEVIGFEKLARHLEVVDQYAKMIDKSGPGTTEGTSPEEDWTEGLPNKDGVSDELGRYIDQIQKLKDAPETVQSRRLLVIERSLQEAILRGEIADDENAQTVKDIIDSRQEKLAQRAAEAEAQREMRKYGLVPLEGEEEMRQYVSEHETEIAAKFRELDPKERDEKVGDIERQASTYYSQIISGFGATPDQAKRGLLEMASRGDDPEGYRRWRAVRLANKLDDAVRIGQLFQPPVDWEETPEKISEILGIMEASDLSVEDLGTTIQGAIGMIQKVEWGTSEGRQMRDSLIGELEAFRGVHALRITLEQNDMDPTNFTEHFRKYFDDKTLANFVRRFGKDRLGRQFQTKDGEAVNLLDVSFELYMQQLRDERIKMNIVEEMTRHAIAGQFGAGELADFKRWLNQDLDQTLQDGKTIKETIEELRQYFVKKMQAKIEKTDELHGLSVDDIWGRKKANFLNITHKVIQEWHDKKTLQGAFGVVEEGDLEDLKEEFGDKFSEGWEGKEFLAIRRSILLDRLQEELSQMGLKVTNEKGEEVKIPLEKLREYGTLESVGLNAYHLAWMMGWSTYDSIRIYSRDSTSQLRDDYDHIVFHDSTNLFFGRQIDQTWEHYSEMNENRGRSKENDVNRIWKQYLPGKHSWLFPQNNMLTRWSDFFLSDAQKQEIARRTRQYMQEWDFDNEKYHGEFEGWMKNAVVRDMIESGEISLGKDGVAAGGNRLSKIAEEMKLRKFEFIDLWVDRTSHKKFTDPAILQDYLANPSKDKFIDMNDKVQEFYSTRDARLFPWMTLAMRAHWEVSNKHLLRLFDRPNLKAEAGEKLTNDLISIGYMERNQGEKEKRKMFGFDQFAGANFGEFFGTSPFRWTRRTLEDMRRFAWEFKLVPTTMTIAGIWAAIVAFFKQLPKELSR